MKRDRTNSDTGRVTGRLGSEIQKDEGELLPVHVTVGPRRAGGSCRAEISLSVFTGGSILQVPRQQNHDRPTKDMGLLY